MAEPITVNIPGMGDVEFPETMSKESINREAAKLYSQSQKTQAPQSQIAPLSRTESFRRSLVQAEQAIPSLIGMTAGGLVGGLGGVPLAGAGSALGETYSQIIQSLPDSLSPLKHVLLGGPVLGSLTGAVEQYQKLRGETPRQPAKPSGLGAAEEIRGAAIAGTAGELGGRAITSVLGKALAPFAKRVVPVQAEAKAVGIPLTPADVVPSSGIIRGVQSRAETSVAGRPVMQRFYEQAAEKAAKVAENISSKIGPVETGMVTGIKFKEALTAAKAVFDKESSAAYESIEQITGAAAPVSTKSVKDTAAALLKRLSPDAPILRASDSKLLPLLKAVGKLPDNMSFSELQLARSTLLNEIRMASGKSNRLLGAEKQLAGAVDDAMMQAAEKAGSGVPKLVRDANALYSRGKSALDSKIIKAIANKNPEDVAAAIWQPKAVSEARAVHAALTGEFSTPETKATWNLIRRRGFETILENATKGDIAGVSLGAFRGQKMLSAWESLQPEIKELLGGNQLAEIQRFMRVAKSANLEKAITLTKNNMGFFETGLSLAVLSTMFGAVTGYAFGPKAGIGTGVTALAILYSPKVAARLMTSPQGIKWLTDGIKMSPVSKEGIKMINRLAAYEAATENPAWEEGKVSLVKPEKMWTTEEVIKGPVGLGASPRPTQTLP